MEMPDSFDEIAAALGLVRVSPVEQPQTPIAPQTPKPVISIPQKARLVVKKKPNGKGKKKAKKANVVKPPPPPPENNRATLRKFFENSNIPLTGGIGYQLVKAYDNFTPEEAKECLARQEEYCRTPRPQAAANSSLKADNSKAKKPLTVKNSLSKNRKPRPQAKKRTNRKQNSKIEVNGHCHVYSFSKTRRQRKIRQQELVLGMNEGSFANFNKCRPLSVVVERVSAEVVKKYRRWNFLKQATLKRLQAKVLLVNNKDCLKAFDKSLAGKDGEAKP